MRGFERFDNGERTYKGMNQRHNMAISFGECYIVSGVYFSGFKAYIGMCEVDLYHTHPVLVSFAEMMTDLVDRENGTACLHMLVRIVEVC